MAEAEYDAAYRAALIALAGIHRSALREVVAGAVAAFVIGKGGWSRERWNDLTADTQRKRLVLAALMRDLPQSAIVSTGPVDAAITAAATALLAREEES